MSRPERYKPSLEDRERVKIRPDKLKVSGDEVFATLQGEGVTAGKPAVFLRLHFCNLRCGWCDTKYTWDVDSQEYWSEPKDWGLRETESYIEKLWLERFGVEEECKRLVITGAEPLLQKERVVELVDLLEGWEVEIETNGTVRIPCELSDCQINCSPKLRNSGNRYQVRVKPEVLKEINNLGNSWFKFVVEKKADLEEVGEIVESCELDKDKILIMPMGSSWEETRGVLDKMGQKIADAGWSMSERKHLKWFGEGRRV